MQIIAIIPRRKILVFKREDKRFVSFEQDLTATELIAERRFAAVATALSWAKRRRYACHYSYTKVGGACASMLRCKTNSANVGAAGGPVSSTTPAVRCTPGKINDRSSENSIWPTANQFFAVSVIGRMRVAASVLQHGRSVDCEGFGGCFCACIGQPSLFSGTSDRGAAVSTQ